MAFSKRDNIWRRAHKAETQYGNKLRQVAKYIAQIIKAFPEGTRESADQLARMLTTYSNSLDPWAHAVARRMLWDVSRRNEDAWIELSKNMGQSLREEIYNTPLGAIMQNLVTEQVGLIKSLPIEAAQRVQALAIGSLETSSRGESIIQEIMKTGEVTISRAKVIAYTEVSRANSALIEARSTHVGSTGYIWRTSQDGIVRPSHVKMEGRFCEWSNPPEVEPGKRYHAGCIYWCRCIPEPVIPDRFK